MQVMRRDGVRAATTRAITAEAEVPHGTFHHCFPAKRDFYAALFERELQQRLAAVSVPPPDVPPREAIRAGLAMFFEAVRADPQRGLVMAELTASVRASLELGDLARWEREQYDARVEASVRAWFEGAPDTGVDPATFARLLVAIGEGVSESWLSNRDDAAAEHALDLAAASLAAALEAGAA